MIHLTTSHFNNGIYYCGIHCKRSSSPLTSTGRDWVESYNNAYSPLFYLPNCNISLSDHLLSHHLLIYLLFLIDIFCYLPITLLFV